MPIFNIYAITNLKNGKVYVGQTVRELGRYLRSDTTRAALNNGDRKPHLYNAIRKWGSHNFDIQLLIKTTGKEHADWWEQFFILLLGTQNREIGYNIAIGGGGSFGYERTFSAEHLEKIRVSSTGRKQSEETKAKRIATMTANGMMSKSPEWREKISRGKMGKKPKPFSEEHRRHMSEAAVAAHARRKATACHPPQQTL